MKRKKPTFEDHQAIGKDVKESYERLSSVVIRLGKVYPKCFKGCRQAAKAFDTVRDLKITLDDWVGTENPKRSNQEINACYYGGTQKEHPETMRGL